MSDAHAPALDFSLTSHALTGHTQAPFHRLQWCELVEVAQHRCSIANTGVLRPSWSCSWICTKHLTVGSGPSCCFARLETLYDHTKALAILPHPSPHSSLRPYPWNAHQKSSCLASQKLEITGSGAPEIQIVAWGLASAGSGAEPQRQRPAITRLQVLVTDDPT